MNKCCCSCVFVFVPPSTRHSTLLPPNCSIKSTKFRTVNRILNDTDYLGCDVTIYRSFSIYIAF